MDGKEFCFGTALKLLKDGKKVARNGWNGKDMFIVYVCASVSEAEIGHMCPDMDVTEVLPWIGMKTVDNKFVPWLCSQTDLLAKDWYTVGEA